MWYKQKYHYLYILSISLILCISISESISAQQITESEAIEKAIRYNPKLLAVALEFRRRKQEVQGEEGRYGFTLYLNGGGTHSELPVATQGGVVLSRKNSADVKTVLEHRWSTGTIAAFETHGTISERLLNPLITSSNLVEIGPTYGLEVRLSARQPLLRGYGKEVGEFELAAARIREEMSEYIRHREASELLRNVLLAYWELWYSERVLDVQTEALRLSNEQYNQARQKVKDGAVAAIDLLTFEARLARFEEVLVEAEAQNKKLAVLLAHLIGHHTRTERLKVTDTPSDPPPLKQNQKETIAAAIDHSYILRELRASVRLYRMTANIAGDSLETKLDLEGYVSLNGLGDRDPIDPFTDVATASAFSAHVGAILELPIDNRQRRSERAAAYLAAEEAEAHLETYKQELVKEAKLLWDELNAARRRIRLSQRTREITSELSEGEKKRYEYGDSLSIKVLETQDEVQQAELRLLRAKVDEALALISIAHLTGHLEKQYIR